MGDLKKRTAVVEEVQTGKTSSQGNSYVRVVLHDGESIDFYHDDFQEELEENRDEYEGLVCEVFFEDRGYTVGKAIVPESSEKARELLDKKMSDDFEGLSEEEKEEAIDKVKKIFDREKGDQEGLESYAS